MARTWILTGSPENHAATAAHAYTVIGLKERNRNRALEIALGDRIVLYATQIKAFAGSIRIAGELYEDRTPIWPGKPGKVDAYPWRFPTSPELTLAEADWIPAGSFVGALDHIAKWPAEHWTLAFQGQIRPINEHDTRILMERLEAAAGTEAAVVSAGAGRAVTP